jgi:hypothetical protein
VPLIAVLLALSAWPNAISGHSFGSNEAARTVAVGIDLAPGCSLRDYPKRPTPTRTLAACASFATSRGGAAR